MRIEQLFYFRDYVATKSQTLAAQKHFLTPQALHFAIKKIEDELNTTLIEKKSKEPILTEQGVLFLEFSRKIIDEYEDLKNKIVIINNKNRDLNGKLFIYSNMIFQRNAIPAIIKKFSNDFPNVQLHLFESDTVNIYSELNKKMPHDNAERLGFFQVPRSQKKLEDEWFNLKNFQYETLYNGFFYACCNNLMNLSENESIIKLLKYPIVLYATSSITIKTKTGIMNPLLLLISEYGNPNISYSVNTMEFWRENILNRQCIGFIHNSLVEQHDKCINGLHIIKIKENIRSDLGCLYEKKKGPLADLFISYVKRYFSTLTI